MAPLPHGQPPRPTVVRRRAVTALAALGVAVLGTALGAAGIARAPAENGSRADGASPYATSAHRGPGIVPFPNVGSTARDFALPALRLQAPWVGTDTVRLSDYRGRWVYLDVFGTWCGPCRAKYAEMSDVARELEERGAAVLGLLLEDRPRSAAAWFADQGGLAYPFAVLDQETSRDWRLAGAPMGFLIDPEGTIVRRCAGCTGEVDGIEGLVDEVAARSRH